MVTKETVLFLFRKMKAAVVLCVVSIAVGLASAFPQKDGAIFSNEAIRQAQNTFLIPKDAQIQKVSPQILFSKKTTFSSSLLPQVQEGIEVAAYENIKGDEQINLFQILGDQVPPEVVSNLQAQVEQIGRQ